eukprot:s3785_g11.t1
MFTASACNLAWFALESGALGTDLAPLASPNCLLCALIHAGALPLTITSLCVMCGETPLAAPAFWLTVLSGLVCTAAAMLRSLPCLALAFACALGAMKDFRRLILREQHIVWRARRELGLTRPVFNAVRFLQPMWTASFVLEGLMFVAPTIPLDTLTCWLVILTVATSKIAVDSPVNIKATYAHMSTQDVEDRAA